jgi:hypothetical protein
LKDVTNTHYVVLSALGIDPSQQAGVSQLKFLVRNASLPAASAPATADTQAVPNANYVAATGNSGPVARPMEYEKTYLGEFTPGANWELVVQDFTGTTTVVTGTGGSTLQISAAPEGSRLKVVTKAPY